MKIGMLFEKDGILALNKPAGVITQGPGGGKLLELWEVVRSRYNRGSIAHRIDQYTSGINLAGVSRRQVGYLMRNWHQITHKVYLAIAKSPVWDEKVVSKPIGGKSAITSFQVLERCGSVALLRCELVQNGRTHQIRRHLKSVGSPVVGDRKYGGPATTARAGQLLHAWRMEIRLPNENGKPGTEWTIVQSPIPDDFKTYGFNWSQWDEGANEVLETWPIEIRSGKEYVAPEKSAKKAGRRLYRSNRIFLQMTPEILLNYRGKYCVYKLIKIAGRLIEKGDPRLFPVRQLEPGLVEVNCTADRLEYLIEQSRQPATA